MAERNISDELSKETSDLEASTIVSSERGKVVFPTSASENIERNVYGVQQPANVPAEICSKESDLAGNPSASAAEIIVVCDSRETTISSESILDISMESEKSQILIDVSEMANSSINSLQKMYDVQKTSVMFSDGASKIHDVPETQSRSSIELSEKTKFSQVLEESATECPFTVGGPITSSESKTELSEIGLISLASSASKMELPEIPVVPVASSVSEVELPEKSDVKNMSIDSAEDTTKICDISLTSSSSTFELWEECDVSDTASVCSNQSSENSDDPELQTKSVDEVLEQLTVEGSSTEPTKISYFPAVPSSSVHSEVCDKEVFTLRKCKVRQKVATCNHEKGNCGVFVWTIENFDTCLFYMRTLTSPNFTMNSRYRAVWRLRLHMRNAINLNMIGVSISGFNIKENNDTLQISVVTTDGSLYSEVPCIMPVRILRLKTIFDEFISKENILLNKDLFLHNHTLKIRCAFNMDHTKFLEKIKFAEYDILAKTMSKTFKDSIYTDARWKIKNEGIRVHRSLLSARSHVLLDMFLDMNEDFVWFNISEMGDYISQQLLTYLYTGNPYRIGCIPFNFTDWTKEHDLILLEHFSEPNVNYCNTRPKISRHNIIWRMKNFMLLETCKVSVLKYPFILNSSDKWEIKVHLKFKDNIIFELKKLQLVNHQCLVHIKIFALCADNCYVLIERSSFTFKEYNLESFSFSLAKSKIKKIVPLYMSDGHFTLKITLKYCYFFHKSEIVGYDMTLFSSMDMEEKADRPRDIVKLAEDMKRLSTSEYFCDCCLKCGDKEYPVHKFMLAPASAYFQRLFQEQDEDFWFINIEGNVDTEILEKMVTYIYSGDIDDLNEDAAMRLIIISKKYELTHLELHCFRYLRSVLSGENFEIIYNITEELEDESIIKEARRVFETVAREKQ